jgi:hypothetical protein
MEFDGTGHVLPMEAPEKVNQIAKIFLDSDQ